MSSNRKSDKTNKKHKKHKKHGIKQKSMHKNNNLNNILNSDEDNLLLNNINLEQTNPVCNSYPVGNSGYYLPNPVYSVQKIKNPDDNKYFHNYKYNYNVQVNKPVLTYDNYITQKAIKNMTNKEYCYYAKLNEKYYYYNGEYNINNDKQNVLTIQTNLNYPMYMGGPTIGEINSQIGYTPQPTKSAPTIDPNSILNLDTNGVQIYSNSPEYYGVQPKTFPGSNITSRNPNNTPNPITGYNPAYSNYGQYYY